MRCARCGIWRGARAPSLVATVVDTEDRCSPTHVPCDDSHRWDWLAQLWNEHGLDLEIVMPDSLVRADPIARLALARQMTIWLAPDPLIQGLREATRLRTHAVAAMLARLPECKAWRFHLRRVVSIDDPRQLALL
jgi:hypothetical protein